MEASVARRGFLLVAIGERQNKAAATAIAGLRARGHDLPIALVTDRAGQDAGADRVELVDGEPYGCRNLPAFLPRSPFAETLFLAHDMMAMARLDPVFDLLAVYDVAAAHAADAGADGGGEADPAVPEPFYALDPGVIAYRSTPTVLACFAAWHAMLVDGAERDPDDPRWHNAQAGLRRALWQHRLAVAVLPPEYNYRAGVAGFLRHRAAVVHSAGLPAARVAQALNAAAGPRVFAPFTAQAPAAYPLGGFATAGTPFGFSRPV